MKEKGRIMAFVFFLALLVYSTFLFAENSRLRGIVENQRVTINIMEEKRSLLAELERKYESLSTNYTLMLEKEEVGKFFESFEELRNWLKNDDTDGLVYNESFTCVNFSETLVKKMRADGYKGVYMVYMNPLSYNVIFSYAISKGSVITAPEWHSFVLVLIRSKCFRPNGTWHYKYAVFFIEPQNDAIAPG
ncbi:MAG: hypothetical protein FGF53_00445 [Candidatus Brockarchaeota archaeon]|nr:hypothetical protein [Candidatus Brockarchaeota archaeon]MBO3808615.1 hypothetical protein [Candidatus Brockarchaeota archaeon]